MVYNKRILNELDLSEKVVFLRLDLNVPVDNGVITSYKRINSTLPTIKYLLDNNAKIVILSHFGRPQTIEDIKSGKFSLEIVAKALAAKIGNLAKEISFISENKGPEVEQKIASLSPKSILVLENTRFNDIGVDGSLINLESGCNEELSKYWAGLCDVFVNDAYGAAHRKHASTYGIAKYQENNAIGFLMNEELKQLTKIVNNPIRPLAVIFGGAKVSDKSKAVEATLKTADKVIISGGMAYTFLAAQGYNMGLSKVENDFLDEARRLLSEYPEKLVISSDFLCSPTFSDTKPVYRTKEEGLEGYMGLDIGERSIKEFEEVINSCNSILWNGPMGVTEFSHYAKGTNDVCDAIAKRTELGAFTVIGGGDSAAAAEKLGKQDSFSWISTGGGASLVLIEGKELMGISSIGESLKKKIIISQKRKIVDNSDIQANEFVNMNSSFENVFEEIFNHEFNDSNVTIIDLFDSVDNEMITQSKINEIYSVDKTDEKKLDSKNEDNKEFEDTYVIENVENVEVFQDGKSFEQEQAYVTEIIEEFVQEIVELEKSIEEEEFVPNVKEVSEEQKNFSKSDYIDPTIYSVIETEIIQDPQIEPKSNIVELEVKNIRTLEKKEMSNSAIKLKNLIKNQRMNLQKIHENQEEQK
ncbi:MAG: phosphoglycerate kinase [Ureaplasma sp.]|nr:phosphoglycerate kinase [Ureaplasma sp.]MDE6289501.1 phosphoglycerate kinase [Ureaplasma sp.]